MFKSKYLNAFLPLVFLLALLGIHYSVDISGEAFAFQPRRASAGELGFHYREAARELGLTHHHQLFPMNPRMRNYDKMYPVGNGVAVADYNGDGYMDIFFTGGQNGERNYLYKNTGGTGFIDVTEEAGLGGDLNSPGVAIAAAFLDFNNDGLKDLFLARVGCDGLYLNVGGGKFKDVSVESGVSGVCRFAASIALFDFDRDGDMDIYIGHNTPEANYLKDSHDFIGHMYVPVPRKSRIKQSGGRNVLLRNDGGTRFTDVSERAAMDDQGYNWALGLIDANHDGWTDVFVANDFSINHFYMNLGHGFFKNTTDSALGLQYSSANMSGETGDVDGDGNVDIFVSNISHSVYAPSMHNMFYFSRGDGTFREAAEEVGLDKCGWAWGSKFFDADRDGHLDLAVANGFFNGGDKSFWYRWAVFLALPGFLVKDPNVMPPSDGYQISKDERNCLFLQQPDGKFRDVAVEAGLSDLLVGRGVATIDMNNDGMMDLVIANHNDRPVFYLGQITNGSHWVGLKLEGTRSSRDAFGAVVRAVTKEGGQIRELFPTNGYGAQSDPRVHFGVGPATDIAIEIVWPSGTVQKIDHLQADRYHDIKEPR